MRPYQWFQLLKKRFKIIFNENSSASWGSFTITNGAKADKRPTSPFQHATVLISNRRHIPCHAVKTKTL